VVRKCAVSLLVAKKRAGVDSGGLSIREQAVLRLNVRRHTRGGPRAGGGIGPVLYRGQARARDWMRVDRDGLCALIRGRGW
jgi:hypothetical protein